MDPAVYKHGEDAFVWGRVGCIVAKTFTLEVTAVYNLIDHQYERVHFRPGLGHYDAVTELGRPVSIRIPCLDARECIAGDRKASEGKVWWAVTPSRRVRQQGRHGRVIGDPSWVAFHRGGDFLWA